MATISPNLPQPIDYSIDVKTPFEASLEGFKLGSDMATIQAAQQKRLLEQQAMQQAQSRQTDLTTGLQKFYNKKPEERSYEEIEKLFSLAANKDQLDALKAIAEGPGKRTVEADKRFYAQVMLGLESEPTVAYKLLADRIAAETDPNQVNALGTILRTAQTVNPAAAVNLIEPYTGFIFGKDWYDTLKDTRAERRLQALAPSAQAEAQAKADKAVADATTAQATAANSTEKAAADAAKATADANKAKVDAEFATPLAQASLNLNAAQIKNINSEIKNRAAKFNLDQQTMQATVAEKLSSIQKNINEIPADTRKLVNESAIAAAASKQSANQYNDLAKRLEAAGGGYGAATSFRDYLTKATGIQSPLTELRQEYIRVRNSAAIKALPPGVATDKDIELALKGIPPENADARTVASFLRGLAKMQDIEASVANAKTDWLASNNGVLTRAKNTFQAGDYATKPGESFNDFTQRVVVDVSKKYQSPSQTDEERRQNLINQIPTNVAPQTPTTPAPANVRSQADAILRGGQ